MKLRRLLGAVLAVPALLLTAIPFAAQAEGVSLTLQVEKYSDGTYTPITETEPGSVFRVALVSNAALPDIGGIRVKLGFNPDAVELRAGSSECMITDINGEFQYNALSSSINALWDTTSTGVTASAGTVMAFYFVSKEVGTAIEAAFTLEVPELFSSSHTVVERETAGTRLTVKPVTIPEADLALYRKLETIVYPDSGEDIRRAEEAFAQYSAAQINALRSGYPTEYSYYANARNEYNRLAALAGEEAVRREAEKFLADHAAVLRMDPETVTLTDKTAVDAAAGDLDKLSPQAKALITSAQQELIKVLKERVAALAEAADAQEAARREAEEFRSNYALLWMVEPGDIEADFDTLPTLILEAVTIHDELLSREAQALLGKERGHLQELYDEVERLTASNAKEKAVLEAVQAFQQRWVTILGLTVNTVKVTDQTALEMMIADIDGQTDAVQQRLASRRRSAVNLLEVIESLLKESGTKPTEPTGPTTPPTTGTTTPSTTPSETDPPVPVVTQPDTPSGTPPAVREMPLIIPILAGILGGTVLLLIAPTCILVQMTRREGKTA